MQKDESPKLHLHPGLTQGVYMLNSLRQTGLHGRHASGQMRRSTRWESKTPRGPGEALLSSPADGPCHALRLQPAQLQLEAGPAPSSRVCMHQAGHGARMRESPALQICVAYPLN